MKRCSTILAVCLCFVFNVRGQTAVPNTAEDSVFVTEQVGEFEIAEELPSYPGGIKAVYEYLLQNGNYPYPTTEEKLTTKQYVSFMVNEDGSLSNFYFIKGISARYDDETVRLLMSMPNWIPAKNNEGESIKHKYILPLVFRFE